MSVNWQQKGYSVVELLTAMALLGLVFYLGFTFIDFPNSARGQRQIINKKLEKYQQSFNAFYRIYNQSDDSEANSKIIESLNSGPVSIRFNSITSGLAIENENSIFIGGTDSELNNLLYYLVLPAPDESSTLCKFATLINEEQWNLNCPNNYYLGLNIAFQDKKIKRIPLAMIDGRICYATEFLNTSNTIRIDTKTNSCDLSKNESSIPLMFILPRLIVFSDDGLFSEAIFESFYDPKDRFGTNHYPQN